ncbi:MAG: tRNA preQ1(34) S-adenosylmethionine ribosyltransferase-isomerase QueA [Planctomycetota bacterium]|jgi:S-adenosylmethionine:tRNA ribosyltransferase-isomerase
MSEKLSDYSFKLPENLIAQAPAESREDSRLLLLNRGNEPEHYHFKDLPQLLQEGDLLVRNTTKVIPARLIGKRSGGGRSEALLVRELQPFLWECLARPTSSLKEGKEISFADGSMVGRIVERLGEGRVVIEFIPENGMDFWLTVEKIGELPLPPYIDRGEEGPTEQDYFRYQTVFAKEAGAVAAPTAGLHFTEQLFMELKGKGVEVCDIVLHVGPGTFRPVKSDLISDHRMDVEYYDISSASAELINNAKRAGRRVIAIGTTSTRALESAADENGILKPGSAGTGIFIYPPYKFKVIDGMITNFHLPESTLLMLVSALYGRENILAAYKEAVESEYRFYSYGDAMLILP